MSVAYAPRTEASAIAASVSLLDLLPVECKPRKAGRDSWRSLCPLHGGDGYSLSIKRGQDRWLFTCFACGEKGDVLTFAMKLYGLSFRDAMARLADGRTFDLTVATRAKRHVPAYLLVCDGKGCGATSEVEVEDVPYLGVTTRTSWHVGPVRSYCWRCAKARTGNGQHGGLPVQTGLTHGRYVG